MSEQEPYTPSRERLILAYQKWAFLTDKDEAEAQVDRILAEVARDAAEKALQAFANNLLELPADDDADVIAWVAERALARASEIWEGKDV